MDTDVKELENQDNSSNVTDNTEVSSASAESSEGQDVNKAHGAGEQDPVDDINEPKIPRYRLNEEIGKRKELENRLKQLETQIEQSRTVSNQQEIAELDKELEDIANESSMSKETLKKMLRLQDRINSTRLIQKDSSDSMVLAEYNIEKFISTKPKAEKFKEEIKQRMLALTPELRKNPNTVGEIYRYLIGAEADKMEAEAEKRGMQKATQQKKIISSVSNDSGTINGNAGKSENYNLTDEEKNIARQYNMTEKEYADYKKLKRR